MTSPPRRQIVDIERGLVLVRYAEAGDPSAPPQVRVSAAPGSEDRLAFVLHPDHPDGATLRHPGTCLVARAEARCRLAIDTLPARQGGSVAATVTVEPLSQGAAPPPPVAPPRAVPRLDDVVLCGHLAHRGDVTVGLGAWLGGPSAPARIEGLRLDWPSRPADLAIRYAVRTGSSRPPAGVDLGTFAGSRGRAAPLTGFDLVMAGPAATRLRWVVDMLFLGQPQVSRAGTRVGGAGPSGREPLVGLRIGLEATAADAPPPPPPAADRVTVFRNDFSRGAARR